MKTHDLICLYLSLASWHDGTLLSALFACHTVAQIFFLSLSLTNLPAISGGDDSMANQHRRRHTDSHFHVPIYIYNATKLFHI